MNNFLPVIDSRIIRLCILVSGTFTINLQAATIPLPLEESIAKVASQLKMICPLADPGSQKAFDDCRQGFFNASHIKQMMGNIVLWGRQKDVALSLKESSLTQFAPDIITGMYMPLFMFDGNYTIEFHPTEKLYLVRLGIAFRNRLQPGQFPYPFWHDDKKWSGYEDANTMLLWIDPQKNQIKIAQFAPTGSTINGYAMTRVKHAPHDGKWLWTDENGKTQPAVTLFDGLYKANNPYKEKLDASYRDFAITLRESQCLNCHVPNNPDKMKRLVLMQTPAHASTEISRILQSIRDQKMPLDEQGIEKPLNPELEKVFLEKGTAFEAIVKAAREWDKDQSNSTANTNRHN